ncbi:MAG TPA: EamA family transporter [Ruminiclostridium sp.]|nr:EamA family transporter [Ruminiclostridium sp.]
MIKYYSFMVLSVVLAAVSQVLLKISANKKHDSFLKEYLNIHVITGYGLLVCSTILTIMAFKGLDYKNGPVIESLGYLFVLLLCRFFLKEKITVRNIVGNLVIIFGIIIFYI